MSASGTTILKYIFLPQILPRAREILQEGFGPIAYCIAILFANTKLLPPTHPYLNPANIGRYTVANILGQAAHNLRFSIRNLDQIALFGMVIVGFVLLFAQVGLMIFSMISGVAHANPASPTSFADYFLSPDPENDISFMALDRIFGIPDVFDSCVALQTPCLGATQTDGNFPQAYHYALQDMLSFYSQGLLVVAAIIFCYMVFTLVAETAEEGKFFGKRFNKSWAPLRMIFAIGLLIPMGSGLNSAQWIVLYVAKYGSGFGTNAWNYYINSLGAQESQLDPLTLLGKPNYPSTNDLIQFMAMAQTCWYAYDDFYTHEHVGTGPTVNYEINAYVVRAYTGGTDAMELDDFLQAYPTLHEAQEWSDNGDITVVFGDLGTQWKTHKGSVRPFCGEINVPTTGINSANPLPTDELTYAYLSEIVSTAWYDTEGDGSVLLGDSGFSTYYIAERVVDRMLNNDATAQMPTTQELRELVQNYDDRVAELVDQAYDDMTDPAIMDLLWETEATEYGWAGAGIWYNKIAQINGMFADTVFNLPLVIKYPEISEFILSERIKSMPVVSGETRFDPHIPPGEDKKNNQLNFAGYHDRKIATVMNKTYVLFNDLQDDISKPSTDNIIQDAINAMFKQSGLWSLRENNNIHPLAQLASLGKTMLINAVITFGGGTAAGLLQKMGKQTMGAALAGTVASLMKSVAMVCLVAGILLYYVVPFLPFIYFFFAVVGWARTIFEAMIGIPLWALAHLRYDGPGFPTQQSLLGYGLLLDIFLRPILIVFGLIASTTCFYAIAKTFNSIFNVATSNLAGFDSDDALGIPNGEAGALTWDRSVIDQLAFSIMYAVILYMIGMGCFKMIDIFPNKIMRWMRHNAVGFASMHQHDHGQQLSSAIQSSTKQAGGAVTGGEQH